MNKLLTESGWKAVVVKSKLKDNGLQRALSVYEKLAEDKYDERLKAVGAVNERGGALKKDKEVAAVPDAVKYLTALLAAAQTEQRGIIQAKDQAEKKAQAEAKKQEQQQQKAQAAQPGKDDEEEDQAGDSYTRVAKALQTLKTSKVPYYFLFCKDKPYGLVVSKKDITKSAQHKKELAAMAGGSTSPPKFGQCRREGSKLIFEMEKPVPGMARILQKWIKDCTGLALKVMVGTESADDEEPGSEPKEMPPIPPALVKAPELWEQARKSIVGRIDQLKAAVRKEFAAEGPDIIGEIEKNMTKLDRVMDAFDDKLTVCLTKAQAAQNEAARKNELSQAKNILAQHINYVKSESMITHIDSNPFGVKTNLRQTLTDALTQMAKAIS